MILLRALQIFTVLSSTGRPFDLLFVGKVKYDSAAVTTASHGVNQNWLWGIPGMFFFLIMMARLRTEHTPHTHHLGKDF